jgi:hypothetical protein
LRTKVIRTKSIRTKVIRTKVIRTKAILTKDIRTKVFRTKVFRTKVFRTKAIRTKAIRTKVIRTKVIGTTRFTFGSSSPSRLWNSFLGIMKAARLAVYKAKKTTAKRAQMADMNLEKTEFHDITMWAKFFAKLIAKLMSNSIIFSTY